MWTRSTSSAGKNGKTEQAITKGKDGGLQPLSVTHASVGGKATWSGNRLEIQQIWAATSSASQPTDCRVGTLSKNRIDALSPEQSHTRKSYAGAGVRD